MRDNNSFTILLNPVQTWRSLMGHWRLIRQLAWRDFSGRYKGSVFGIVWPLVTPACMLIVYTFLFGILFRPAWAQGRSFSNLDLAISIFCGMTVFSIFGETITRASNLIMENPNYVKRVLFPLEALPVSSLCCNLMNASINLAVLGLAQLILNQSISKTIFLFPIILAPLLFFTLGIAYIVSSLGVFFRDLGQFVNLLITILFLLSGVFFPVSAFPEKYQLFLNLNPLSILLEESRNILLWGRVPDWTSLLFPTVMSIIVMQLGYSWFLLTKKGFADVI